MLPARGMQARRNTHRCGVACRVCCKLQGGKREVHEVITKEDDLCMVAAAVREL